MENKPLIILGSARKSSDTRKLIDKLFPAGNMVLLDLLDFEVNNYNYLHQYPETDDFEKLVQVMLQHEKLVFATPVYWYAMSGLMKTFFDRLTDIVTVRKTLGRRLAGKEAFLIAVGAEDALPVGFAEPFRLTAAYFDMHFKGVYYASSSSLKGSMPDTDAFMQLLKL
ncbi:flavodoxin family protein [Pontibacter cellulosilyticus]|uniref:NAD(P)H-dependent oxidoreductase n=1 Tax=Pontibacter cellulosilyticus TaxID=1720253 RepID=A0A923N3V7_9BACT|nr:NAD(P)H-dependent oxidoreductase [Pontibacter cellulosilyticus]MBC5991758.1 NAD(P)H-dependent oxidoreductase [Pontibacter cellulosilyticus]